MNATQSRGAENLRKEGSVDTPVPKKPRNLLFIFMLIGMCLGGLVLVPRIPGLFDTWEKISPAPGKPIVLIGTSSFWFEPGKVYIKAEDGEVYMLTMGNDNWTPAPQGYEIESSACDLVTIKFSGWKRPFEAPFQCAKVYGHGDVAPPPEFNFVLDQNGYIWFWAQESILILLCMLPVTSGIGMIGGILFNFMWLAIVRIRLNLSKQETLPQGLEARKLELKTLRGVGRAWSILSILLIPLNSTQETIGIILLVVSIIAVIGLIIGWRRPLVGGWIATCCFLIRMVLDLARVILVEPALPLLGDDGSGIIWVIIIDTFLFVPGILFLIYGWLMREKPNAEKPS